MEGRKRRVAASTSQPAEQDAELVLSVPRDRNGRATPSFRAIRVIGGLLSGCELRGTANNRQDAKVADSTIALKEVGIGLFPNLDVEY